MLLDLAYPISERTLDNGLRVVASPDHAAPSVAVNLWYDVGSRHEEPGRTGFAHLFEHVMFQGSAQVASGEHIGILQAAGASVNATTYFDRTNYFETLPVGGLDLALWLEADRMATLPDALTQANLDTQREVVKEEKRQRYDNVPYGDVMERLVGLTFPEDHPYGHTVIGSMPDLDAATVTDVTSFFRTFYRPNNAVLSVVGDVTAETAFARAGTFFGDLEPGEPPPARRAAPLPPIAGRPEHETTADVPAEAVYLTWRLPARDTAAFDALDLAFTVLGHGQTSRAYRALVRTEELAESASATTLGLIGGNSFGFASARARAGVSLEQVTGVLRAEVDRLATDGPTEAELARAQAQFERHWLHQLARVDARADALGEFATLLADPTLVNTRIAAISRISVADVVDALRAWGGTDRCATLHYRKADR